MLASKGQRERGWAEGPVELRKMHKYANYRYTNEEIARAEMVLLETAVNFSELYTIDYEPDGIY